MARPSKYSRAMQDKICELIGEGLSQTRTCDLVGINPDTFAEWNKSKPVFSEAVKKAKAENEQWHLSQIRAGAQHGSWQASAWYLERTNPATYGRVAVLPAPATENTVKTKLDLLIEGFKQETHRPDYTDTSEADNGQTE